MVLASGDRFIAKRAVQHHVLGEDAGKSGFVSAAVHGVHEGFHGVAVRGERGHSLS